MGEVLQFQTKAERAQLAPLPSYDEMTADDRFAYLYSKTLVHMRDLAHLYRGTKRFTPDHEAVMVKTVTAFKQMCLDLAGTTGDSHATTPNVG